MELGDLMVLDSAQLEPDRWVPVPEVRDAPLAVCRTTNRPDTLVIRPWGRWPLLMLPKPRLAVTPQCVGRGSVGVGGAIPCHILERWEFLSLDSYVRPILWMRRPSKAIVAVMCYLVRYLDLPWIGSITSAVIKRQINSYPPFLERHRPPIPQHLSTHGRWVPLSPWISTSLPGPFQVLLPVFPQQFMAPSTL